MRPPKSVATLNDLGRVQLSKTYYMREFLYSEIGNLHGIPNIPENPDLAIEVGKRICEDLLEPLQDRFGRIAIRSAYRTKQVNGFGNEQMRANKKGYACLKRSQLSGPHIGRAG